MNALSFRRCLPPRDMQAMAKLTVILTRCDDLDAQSTPGGVLDRDQVRRDSRRIREMAEEARLLLLGVTP